MTIGHDKAASATSSAGPWFVLLLLSLSDYLDKRPGIYGNIRPCPGAHLVLLCTISQCHCTLLLQCVMSVFLPSRETQVNAGNYAHNMSGMPGLKLTCLNRYRDTGYIQEEATQDGTDRLTNDSKQTELSISQTRN